MQERMSPVAREAITYLGKIPYHQVKEEIQKAHICVFPSLAETLGMVTIESMALQKVVVNTSIGWAQDLIEHSKDGFMHHPDDIDALLDSMGIDEASVMDDDSTAANDTEQAEISDPDDIDAILDSMGIDEASVLEDEINKSSEIELNESTEEGEEQPESSISENKAKIDNLSEEYVAPFLSADFSDILAISPDEIEKENEPALENDINDDEEFDIDDLIAEVEQSKEELIADIEQSSTEAVQEEASLEEELDIGDDLLSETFDEETLTELLQDNESEPAIELSPDFSDQNVLADLLNDDDEVNEIQVTEASEINDIQELDNLNFDELLANIEEESSVANQVADFNQITDNNEEVSLEDFDNFTSIADQATNSFESDSGEDDFVSVDSLLSDSQLASEPDEPYKKANIDVGLNEFPEFTSDVNPIDVDADENGIAAKLDLAKVYLEIGDEDNAQVILKEIIKLGDPQQQAEAQHLLSDI